MAKTIVPCVHCGKPVPVDALDRDDIEKILAPLRGDIAQIKFPEMKLPEPDLKPLQEILTKLETQVASIQEGQIDDLTEQLANAKGQLAGHPTPTPALVKTWETCQGEDCRTGWEGIKQGIEENARRSYIAEGELPKRLEEMAKGKHLHTAEGLVDCPDCLKTTIKTLKARQPKGRKFFWEE